MSSRESNLSQSSASPMRPMEAQNSGSMSFLAPQFSNNAASGKSSWEPQRPTGRTSLDVSSANSVGSSSVNSRPSTQQRGRKKERGQSHSSAGPSRSPSLGTRSHDATDIDAGDQLVEPLEALSLQIIHDRAAKQHAKELEQQRRQVELQTETADDPNPCDDVSLISYSQPVPEDVQLPADGDDQSEIYPLQQQQQFPPSFVDGAGSVVANAYDGDSITTANHSHQDDDLDDFEQESLAIDNNPNNKNNTHNELGSGTQESTNVVPCHQSMDRLEEEESACKQGKDMEQNSIFFEEPVAVGKSMMFDDVDDEDGAVGEVVFQSVAPEVLPIDVDRERQGFHETVDWEALARATSFTLAAVPLMDTTEDSHSHNQEVKSNAVSQGSPERALSERLDNIEPDPAIDVNVDVETDKSDESAVAETAAAAAAESLSSKSQRNAWPQVAAEEEEEEVYENDFAEQSLSDGNAIVDNVYSPEFETDAQQSSSMCHDDSSIAAADEPAASQAPTDSVAAEEYDQSPEAPADAVAAEEYDQSPEAPADSVAPEEYDQSPEVPTDTIAAEEYDQSFEAAEDNSISSPPTAVVDTAQEDGEIAQEETMYIVDRTEENIAAEEQRKELEEQAIREAEARRIAEEREQEQLQREKEELARQAAEEEAKRLAAEKALQEQKALEAAQQEKERLRLIAEKRKEQERLEAIEKEKADAERERERKQERERHAELEKEREKDREIERVKLVDALRLKIIETDKARAKLAEATRDKDREELKERERLAEIEREKIRERQREDRARQQLEQELEQQESRNVVPLSPSVSASPLVRNQSQAQLQSTGAATPILSSGPSSDIPKLTRRVSFSLKPEQAASSSNLNAEDSANASGNASGNSTSRRDSGTESTIASPVGNLKASFSASMSFKAKSPVSRLRSIVFGSKSIDGSDNQNFEKARREAAQAAERLQQMKDEPEKQREQQRLEQKRRDSEDRIRKEELQQRTGRAKSLGFVSIKTGLSKREYSRLVERSPVKPLQPIKSLAETEADHSNRDDPLEHSTATMDDKGSPLTRTQSRGKRRLSFATASTTPRESSRGSNRDLNSLLPGKGGLREGDRAGVDEALSLLLSVPSDDSLAVLADLFDIRGNATNRDQLSKTPTSKSSRDRIQSKNRDNNTSSSSAANVESIVDLQSDLVYSALQSDNLVERRFGWDHTTNFQKLQRMQRPETIDTSRFTSFKTGKRGNLSSAASSSNKDSKKVVLAPVDFIPGFDDDECPDDRDDVDEMSSSSAAAAFGFQSSVSATSFVTTSEGGMHGDEVNSRNGSPTTSLRSSRFIFGSNSDLNQSTRPIESPSNASSSGRNHVNSKKKNPNALKPGSIFANYSGMLFRDPQSTTTWKETNRPIHSPESKKRTQDLLLKDPNLVAFASATKRNLSAGRMLNAYRPWSREPVVDPLDQLLINQLAAQQAVEGQSTSRSSDARHPQNNEWNDRPRSRHDHDRDNYSQNSDASSGDKEKSRKKTKNAQARLRQRRAQQQQEQQEQEQEDQRDKTLSSQTGAQTMHSSLSTDSLRQRTASRQRVATKQRQALVINFIANNNNSNSSSTNTSPSPANGSGLNGSTWAGIPPRQLFTSTM